MKNKVLFLLSAFIFVVLISCFFYARIKNDTVTVTLLHTNDLHAHFLPWRADGSPCSDKDETCLGGFARLKNVIDTARRTDENLILLDAGDRFSGTIFYTLRKSVDLAPLLNTFHYDAMTAGNHDFDDGWMELERFAEASSAPLILSNVSFPKESSLTAKTHRSLILERQNRKIGIIGVLTEETLSTSGNAHDIVISPVVHTVQKEIARFKQSGVSVIVVLSHIGLEQDKILAETCPDIDVIIGGHSHSLLSNTETEAVGPYPIVIPHADGTQTLIVTSGIGGQHLGRLSVTFDRQGRIVAHQGDTIRITSSVTPDSRISAQISSIQNTLSTLLNAPVFQATENLTLTPGRLFCSESCPVGEALTNALKQAVPDADFAFINAGGIRSGLAHGKVTYQQLAQAYPFDSSVVTVKMSGRDIYDYIAHGLEEYDPNDRTNAFLQTAGIGYDFDPETRKITHLFLSDAPKETLSETHIYTVVLPSFLAQGGDKFPVRPIERVVAPSVREAIRNSLKQQNPHAFQNRIQKKK